MSRILENVETLKRRAAEACRRAGRKPEDVELVAVAKYATAAQLAELLEAGAVRHVGENRLQDAERRRLAVGPELARRAAWRFIGHLQRNKAKAAAGSFDALDSLDSLELAAALERELRRLGRRLPVLVQANAAGNPDQHGVEPERLGEFLEKLKGFPSLEPKGLMAIAPMLEPVEATRPFFESARKLAEKHFERPELSLGMSRDFEVAIEEGATMVRIGSALFEQDKIS